MKPFLFDISLSYYPAGRAKDDGEELCWHYVDVDVTQEGMRAEMHHLCRLLERAEGRVDLQDFHLEAGEEIPTPTRRDVMLPHHLIRQLCACQMDFSYLAHCSFYKDSRYKTDKFYVLTPSTPELWTAMLAVRDEKMAHWNTVTGEYQGRPYMMLDGTENGSTALLSMLAQRTPTPLGGTVRVDYFSNCSCVFHDLDAEDFANLCKLGVHLEISLHPAMKIAPDEGSLPAALLRHATRTARQLTARRD